MHARNRKACMGGEDSERFLESQREGGNKEARVLPRGRHAMHAYLRRCFASSPCRPYIAAICGSNVKCVIRLQRETKRFKRRFPLAAAAFLVGEFNMRNVRAEIFFNFLQDDNFS